MKQTEIIAKSKQVQSRLTELEAMVFAKDKLTISINSTENNDINNTVVGKPKSTARNKDNNSEDSPQPSPPQNIKFRSKSLNDSTTRTSESSNDKRANYQVYTQHQRQFESIRNPN